LNLINLLGQTFYFTQTNIHSNIMNQDKGFMQSAKEAAVSPIRSSTSSTNPEQLGIWRGETKQPATRADVQHEIHTRSKTNASSGNKNDGQRNTRQATHSTRYADVGLSKLHDTIHSLHTEAKKQEHRYSSLSGHVRKLKNDKREMEDRNESQDADLKNLKERYDKVLSIAVLPYARSKGIGFNQQTGEPVEAILRRLIQDALRAEIPPTRTVIQTPASRHTDAHVQNLIAQWKASNLEIQDLRKRIPELEDQEQDLRAQVQDLQTELLSRVDETGAVSDDQLAQDFRTLISMVRTLSRMISFDSSVDVVEILASPGFLQDVSPHHWRGRARKKRFIEAWTWTVLYQMIFESPFSIFEADGNRVDEIWKAIFGCGHLLDWPSPSSASELWRYTTTEQLVKMVGETAIVQGLGDRKMEGLSKIVLDARSYVQSIVEAHMHSIDPKADTTQIGRIIDKAFKLAMIMSLQHSRLQMTFPKVGAEFVMASMVVVPDRDGEDISDGIVAYVTHPGLTKWGDARGENYEHRLDIVSSLVQLEDAGIKHEAH
jgi:hypothetical protein